MNMGKKAFLTALIDQLQEIIAKIGVSGKGLWIGNRIFFPLSLLWSVFGQPGSLLYQLQ